LIASEVYRGSTYGRGHPLAIPRIAATMDLIDTLGWRETRRYLEAEPAAPERLIRFHDPDYVAALRRAERDQRLDDAERRHWNIGVNGNPIYPEMFRRPATACDASLKAAHLIARAPATVHALPGGTHHGRPNRASGFCFLNDLALAILDLFDRGFERLVYVDLDAHHGDGVQDAFDGDPRLLVISIHEAGRWPRTGAVADRGRGMARNFALPAGVNDDEFAFVIGEGVLPLASAHRPQALIIQGGCDGLADDPMSGFALSNNALWRAVAELLPLADRVIVTGGGGYNPWALARCWAGMWGMIDGRAPPDRLPAPAESLLRGLTWRRSQGRNPPDHWFTTLADPPRHGAIRPEVRAVVARVTEASP
jgi:acetoin utilization protein AcuC